MDVTYIANTGFLITTKTKKILIDSLFGKGELDYCDIPKKEIIYQMENENTPFDEIDIITASHVHRDHFDANIVMKHLYNNQRGVFISTQQSVNELRKVHDDYQVIKDRVLEINIELGNNVKIKKNNIEMKIFRFKHSPYYIIDEKNSVKYDKHGDIQNLCFLFNVDGINIFHSGDCELFSNIRLDKEDIDLAFLDLSKSILLKELNSGFKIINKFIKPKHIIITHTHPDDKEELVEISKKFKESFPSVTVFESPMEKKVFDDL